MLKGKIEVEKCDSGRGKGTLPYVLGGMFFERLALNKLAESQNAEADQ